MPIFSQASAVVRPFRYALVIKKQAKAFRKLADKRAKELGLAPWNRHRYPEDLVCFYARPRKICGLTPAD